MTHSKEITLLAVAGGVGFWAANFAISLTPIAAEYRTALSISYFPMLLEALIGGLIIGFCVAITLYQFADKLPTKSSILNAVFLSSLVLIIVTLLIEVPGKFFVLKYDALRYFLIGGIFNILRICTLGITVGYFYEILNKHPKNES